MLLVVGLTLGAQGCAYTMRLASSPGSAEITLPDGKVVVTPTTQTFVLRPFGHQWIEVRAPGYRTMRVDVRRRQVRTLRYVTDSIMHPSMVMGANRGDIRFVLVPDHGGVGSWDVTEVP
jgi:hypothetical protein